MPKNPRILKQIETIEGEIIAWGRLLSTCKPDSTRLEVRIEAIENLIQVRKGLRRLLETP